MLRLLAETADKKDVDRWLDMAQLSIDIEKSLEQAAGRFLTLCDHSSRSTRAEGYYGLACLAAIEENGAKAATLLQRACEEAGDHSVVYRDRATLDEDLDPIRSDPDFAAFCPTQSAEL